MIEKPDLASLVAQMESLRHQATFAAADSISRAFAGVAADFPGVEFRLPAVGSYVQSSVPVAGAARLNYAPQILKDFKGDAKLERLANAILAAQRIVKDLNRHFGIDMPGHTILPPDRAPIYESEAFRARDMGELGVEVTYAPKGADTAAVIVFRGGGAALLRETFARGETGDAFLLGPCDLARAEVANLDAPGPRI